MSIAPDAQNAVSSPDKPRETGISPLLWLLFLAAIQLVGPFLPIPSAIAALLGGVALTLIYIGAVIAFALGIARLHLSIPRALVYFEASVAIWLAIQYVVLPGIIRDLIVLKKQEIAPSAAQLFAFSAAETLQDLALFCGAIFAGTLLSRLIRHANMIGPIGAAIALIDIWGVLFGGIVSQLMTNKATQPLAQKAMASGPKLGTATGGKAARFAIELPAIGVGDFLFIALLLSVLVNLAMNWQKSAKLMWILVCFALLSMQFLPFFPALPGLLFIGAAAVLPNWKYFTFTREERFALLYAGIFVLILTVGLYFGFKAMLPTPK